MATQAKKSVPFKTLSNFLGYVTRSDQTNMNARYLVSGSQNVVINDSEKVSVRGGYSIFGVANSATTPIRSKFDWKTSGQVGSSLTHNGRLYDDELEVYVRTVNDVVFNSWEKLKDSLSTTALLRWTTWWSSAQSQDVLLYVIGDATINEWSGGITTFASATTNTITKQGTATWAGDRFLSGASFSGGSTTREVRIKDSGGTWRTFAYTGGETTTTITGVSPDPTAFTFSAGALVLQEIRSYSNEPATGVTNEVISTLANQVYVGGSRSRVVYISNDDDFTDFTNTASPVPGDPKLVTIDDVIIGFAPVGETMVVFGGLDSIFRTKFSVVGDATGVKQDVQIKKLRAGTRQGAFSQEHITTVGNSIVYLSNEPALRMLENIEAVDSLETSFFKALSNPVKPDFDAEDFSDGSTFFNKNKILVSAPTNGKVYILEIVENEAGEIRRFWQPPQVLPIGVFSIIDDVLHGHSSQVPETYKLFTGTNDNGNPFTSLARFAYQSYGRRPDLKTFDEHYTEGYMSSNTELTMRLRYNYTGDERILERTLMGNDDAIIEEVTSDDSLGLHSLGDISLSGTPDVFSLPKFRVISEMESTNFHELQVEYETNGTDQQWQLLAFGPKVSLSIEKPTTIKQ
jgi:hypothetical protein